MNAEHEVDRSKVLFFQDRCGPTTNRNHPPASETVVKPHGRLNFCSARDIPQTTFAASDIGWLICPRWPDSIS